MRIVAVVIAVMLLAGLVEFGSSKDPSNPVIRPGGMVHQGRAA